MNIPENICFAFGSACVKSVNVIDPCSIPIEFFMRRNVKCVTSVKLEVTWL